MTAARPLRWRMIATHVPAGGGLGGMVRYVVELAAALHKRPDIHLSVVTTAEASPFFAELLGDPAKVAALPALPVAGRSVVERFTRRCEAGDPVDVLHGTKHLLPRRANALRLLTVHDMLPFERPGDFGPLKRALLRLPYRSSIQDADAIVCVSAATERSMVRWVPGSGAHAHAVPLAMSTALRTAQARPVAALQSRPFALVVGDASPRKNLPLVVGVWRRIVAAVPGSVLAIVGPSGWNTNEYGADYDRLRREGLIVELGRVGDAELRWCYENAQVTLCPSLLEGFGLPAVEALAFGSPLITSLDAALCEATGERAVHLSTDDRDAWVAAIVERLSSPDRPASTAVMPRTWDEVADETVAFARSRTKPA